ncbi:MAG TPA: glycogen debranching enzyme N-terminal domain-containing protein, partial [Myxococcota bacterium]|nr:glycogen debranching enzyme N-terminal domain-containing protein [Myxococcota bacterium]
MTDGLDLREWLEADGLGGFASGTVSGVRTRRYHALLLAAATPPTGRQVLVNGLEVWLETPMGVVALSSQRYLPDVVHPDGASRIAAFSPEPWPTWRLRAAEGLELEHEVLVQRGAPLALATWRLVTPADGVRLCVRPLLSGRDYHALHHENPVFRLAPRS